MKRDQKVRQIDEKGSRKLGRHMKRGAESWEDT